MKISLHVIFPSMKNVQNGLTLPDMFISINWHLKEYIGDDHDWQYIAMILFVDYGFVTHTQLCYQ